MNKRKRRQENAKTAYSLFSNYHFIYSNMWSYDKKLFGYGIAEIIFNVLMPLGAVITPAIVIGLLAKKAELPEFIRTIVIVFLIYSILSGVYTFLRARNWYQYPTNIEAETRRPRNARMLGTRTVMGSAPLICAFHRANVRASIFWWPILGAMRGASIDGALTSSAPSAFSPASP
jgi:hypothetical protein